MKPKAIICDLDGTLCNVKHRLHFIEGKKKDWEAFHNALINDTANEDVIEKLVLHEFREEFVIFVTGRPSRYSTETLTWLRLQVPSSVLFDIHQIFMRPQGDTRPDTELKADIYENQIKPHFDVVKVYEDRPSVIRMWRSKGLEVEDVGEGIEF